MYSSRSGGKIKLHPRLQIHEKYDQCDEMRNFIFAIEVKNAYSALLCETRKYNLHSWWVPLWVKRRTYACCTTSSCRTKEARKSAKKIVKRTEQQLIVKNCDLRHSQNPTILMFPHHSSARRRSSHNRANNRPFSHENWNIWRVERLPKKKEKK